MPPASCQSSLLASIIAHTRPACAGEAASPILPSSREISGALNRALPALRKIRREARFTETHSTREQWKEFQRATSPLGLWLEAETVSTGSALVAQDELHAAYLGRSRSAMIFSLLEVVFTAYK